MWYCPKKCDNDILTIFWKWYDIRYHDILSNDMQRVAWVAFICVSSLSLQYPKIVYLPQAVKSLLFPNQKRTQKFWKGDPIFNRKGTKSGPYVNDIERDPNFFSFLKTLTYRLNPAVLCNYLGKVAKKKYSLLVGPGY